MAYQSRVIMAVVACVTIGTLLAGAGCSPKQAPPAPTPALETPTEAVPELEAPRQAAPVKVAPEPRVLGPEDPPQDADDAACREFLRANEKVREILGDAPRFTFETQQSTPAGNISLYTAEGPWRTVKLRVLWDKPAGDLQVKGIDCQYREGAAFMRAWTPAG